MADPEKHETASAGRAGGQERETRGPEPPESRPSWLPGRPLEALTAAPFEIMRRMRDEMERWMGAGAAGPGRGGVWSPAVEMSEQDGLLRIFVELPGLARDDVKVELMKDGLLISGERRTERAAPPGEGAAGGVYRSERSYGPFRRCLALPAEARTDQVKARFEGGLLKITMPMAEPSSLRREIPIEAGESGTPAPPDRDPTHSRHMRTAI